MADKKFTFSSQSRQLLDSYNKSDKVQKGNAKADKLNAKLDIRKAKKEISSYRKDNANGVLSIFGIIIAIILIVAVFRMLNGSNNIPTFESFLDMLINLDTVDLGFINNSVIVLGDWGVFNFLRDFIAFFIDIINVLIFVFNGLINLVLYCYSILRWIFV